MNFDRSLIFSYLEEDNIQRAFFRVRPLLTRDGDVQQEALQLWPNEGGLRIVPDRNEQHTFKVRMRKLGSFCVVDLRDQRVEAGKIRTNKNYRPDHGEINQYILYSDTVHELPEDTFYQLMDGSAADYQILAKDAITPLFYIREGDTLYGPLHKDTPSQPQPAQEAAGMLFEIACPDGVTRSILCMDDGKAPEKPVPVNEVKPETTENSESSVSETTIAEQPEVIEKAAEASPAAETLPIGESLHILDHNRGHEETLRQLDKPVSSGANLLHQNAQESALAPAPIRRDENLAGTPLIRTPLHMAAPQTKNHTQEIITNQWSVGKYEPPTQNLPAGTAMRAVNNPVEAACSALRSAWDSSVSHDQLIDFILSLDGLRPQLETKLCNGQSVTAMQRILRQRLQDLEAERLTALCELDRAHRDVDAYKQELLTALAARITRETCKLETDKDIASTQVEALKKEINALTLQRDALMAKVNELHSSILPEAVAKLVTEAQMSAPVSGIPLRMSPVSGTDADIEELIARLMKTCEDSSVKIDRNTAIALLVLLAISPRIGISCPSTAAVSTLLRNIACAFGWRSSYAHQFAAEQHPLVGLRPVDSTPAIWATSLPNYAPVVGATKLTLSRSAANLTHNAAYDVSQWPVLMLPALPFVPELDASGQPISAAAVAKVAEQNSVSTAELDTVLSPVLNAAIPLSGSARKELYRFVSVCASLMEGGLPVAVDWGILLWVLPNVERGSRHYPAVKALLDEYPLSLYKL